MSRNPRVGIFLHPAIPKVPFDRILDAWLKRGFRPKECRDALERIIAKEKIRPDLFDPRAITDGGMPATARLLYPRVDEWTFVLNFGDSRNAAARIKPSELPAMAALIGSLAAKPLGEAADLWRRFFGQDLADAVKRSVAWRPGRWRPVGRPGIYRQEHASLVIRSRTTTLLVDPISLAAWVFPYVHAAPLHRGTDSFDGILVTHGHEDHLQYASLVYYARSKVPVFVPRVPKASLLSDGQEFETALRSLAQDARAPRWWSSVKVGDIEIDVLPFYGEQPTRYPPGPPDPQVRSWGNCYRFNAPDFSVLILTDSGADPAGDMADVVRKSVEEKGPIDVVMSSVRELPAAFFGGLSTYWTALPFRELRSLYLQHKRGSLPTTTAGPEGDAEICKAAKARFFLPYANGFEGVGRRLRDVGWGMGEPSEAEMLRRVRRGLDRAGARTRAVSWKPGDAFLFRKGELALSAP